MLISLNKIKSYVKIPDGVTDQDLLKLIGSRLVEIEEAVDWSNRYQKIYIAKVISCEPIPETHLHLCRIDAGEYGTEVQVVCGAPNVHTGMLAVWIAPGAIVPSTYGNENFKLSVRKLRGYESHGMLAGADELGFDNEHKSIAEIDPKMAKAGDIFAEVFDLNDIIIDVENKSLTHRPDCFGLIGFAREVAGILGEPFVEPEVFQKVSATSSASSEELEIEITDSKLCPRYSAAVFDLPSNEPSKYLTHEAVLLAKAGMRSIDPMVDLTNIMMLETGQPLHAFDYDKLIAVGGSEVPKIIVRAAQDGEELQLLDGKTIQCIPADILITSNNIPVALAGAMGGKNTEVDASTKRIILESATFSLYHLRKTQMAHGIFSEAITRFTKGQPAAMAFRVLLETINRLKVTPSAIVDLYPDPVKETVVKITTEEINGLLGTNYDADTIIKTLEDVGFEVEATAIASSERIRSHDEDEHADPATAGVGDAPRGRGNRVAAILKVTSPYWRTDIHIQEDIIEEVGRLLGYDNIPLALPEKPFVEPEIDPMLQLKKELRNILSDRLAMNEVLTYSFISRSLLEKVGLNVADSYEIVNSISPELQCFRQQIAPSLIDKMRENIKSGHENFTLYEINQVSRKGKLTEEQTPIVKTHLGIVGLGDFYRLKAELLQVFRDLKIKIEYAAISTETAKHDAYLEPKRSAEIFVDGQKVGAFGEVKLSVQKQFKLEQPICAAEINLEKIVTAPRQAQTEIKLSKFPAVERDVTLTVATDMVFGRILAALEECLAKMGLYFTVTPVSIYQASDAATTKNLSFHLKFSDPTKTLNSDEISAIMSHITVNLAGLGTTVV